MNPVLYNNLLAYARRCLIDGSLLEPADYVHEAILLVGLQDEILLKKKIKGLSYTELSTQYGKTELVDYKIIRRYAVKETRLTCKRCGFDKAPDQMNKNVSTSGFIHLMDTCSRCHNKHNNTRHTNRLLSDPDYAAQYTKPDGSLMMSSYEKYRETSLKSAKDYQARRLLAVKAWATQNPESFQEYKEKLNQIWRTSSAKYQVKSKQRAAEDPEYAQYLKECRRKYAERERLKRQSDPAYDQACKAKHAARTAKKRAEKIASKRVQH